MFAEEIQLREGFPVGIREIRIAHKNPNSPGYGYWRVSEWLVKEFSSSQEEALSYEEELMNHLQLLLETEWFEQSIRKAWEGYHFEQLFPMCSDEVPGKYLSLTTTFSAPLQGKVFRMKFEFFPYLLPSQGAKVCWFKAGVRIINNPRFPRGVYQHVKWSPLPLQKHRKKSLKKLVSGYGALLRTLPSALVPEKGSEEVAKTKPRRKGLSLGGFLRDSS